LVLQSQEQPESPSERDAENDHDYEQGYVTNQNGVSRDMLSFLRDFYNQFPEKRNADLYITSESYGGHYFANELTLGKYAPSIATAILDYNEQTSDSIPLKGIAIGNQWTDPNTQVLTHAAQAFYLGLVDEAQSQHLLSIAHEAVGINLVRALHATLNLRRETP
jgi:vitellogenic carboxypeptidase-like protein